MLEDIKKLALELVDACAIGELCDVDEDGKPQIKAMFKTKNEGIKTFWFCTNTSSKRVQELIRILRFK